MLDMQPPIRLDRKFFFSNVFSRASKNFEWSYTMCCVHREHEHSNKC